MLKLGLGLGLVGARVSRVRVYVAVVISCEPEVFISESSEQLF